MPLRFLFWVSFMWIGLTILFGLVDFDPTLGIDSDNNFNEDFNSLLVLNSISVVGITFPVPSFSTLTSLGNMLTWNYPFFQGHWVLVRIFLLLPITFGALLMFFQTLGPVFIAVLNAVGNAGAVVTGAVGTALKGVSGLR